MPGALGNGNVSPGETPPQQPPPASHHTKPEGASTSGPFAAPPAEVPPPGAPGAEPAATGPFSAPAAAATAAPAAPPATSASPTVGAPDPGAPAGIDWQVVADQLPFGLVVLGPAQELVHENGTCADLTGHSVAEAGGIEPWLAALCPDDRHREQVIQSWREHIWRNQLTRTFSLKGSDQKVRELEFRSALLPDGGISLSIQDVTDIRRTEEIQRHGKLKFRALFSHTENGSVLVDRTGRIIDANRAFLELVDVPLRDIRMTSFGDLLHPRDAASLANAEKVLRSSAQIPSDRSISKEVVLRARSCEKQVRLTYCPIGEDPRTPTIGLYLVSLAPDHSLEEALTAKLRTVARKAQSLLEAVPDLILLIDPDLTIVDFAPPPVPWKELTPEDSWRGQPADLAWPALGEFLSQSAETVVEQGKTAQARLEGRSGETYCLGVSVSSAGDGQMLVVVRQEPGSGETGAPAAAPFDILEQLPTATVIMDAGSHVLRCNPAALQLLGESREEAILGQPLSRRFRRLSESGDGNMPQRGILFTSTGDGVEIEFTAFPFPDAEGEPRLGVELRPAPARSDSPGAATSPDPDLRSELEQHRFRNRLQLVTSLFSMEPQGAAARDSFLRWQTRLRALARSFPENEAAKVGSFLRGLADDLSSLTRRGPGHLVVVVNAPDDLTMPASGTTPFALLAGEILRAVLASHQHGPGHDLLVEARREGKDTGRLVFQAGEGRRFPASGEDVDLEVLELLAEQLGGRLDSSRDTAWELVLPLESA